MERVWIANLAVAHPEGRVSQAEAVGHVAKLGADARRAAAIARGTRIARRAIVLPPDEIARLNTIEERNNHYRRFAPALALEASRAALDEADRSQVGCLVTSSCTGYALPGWRTEIVEPLGLPCDAALLPITESGCAGGVVALARAADYLRSRPGELGLVTAVELCSLSFHPGGPEGNLIAGLIFGDAAGAALLATGPPLAGALEIVDSSSMLIPGTREALGYDLTDQGFYPVLTRRLIEVLPPATLAAATRLLQRNGLAPRDVEAWLLHPGGARILSRIEDRLGVGRGRTHWSWDSMAEFGNTSSAAVFDVLRRYREEPRGEWSVVGAFGPGVSIELLLVRRCS